MNASLPLIGLLEKGFELSGERVAMGFDLALIAPTIAKMPAEIGDELRSLFATAWPAESFFLGFIELLSPDRINEEHDALLPGCLIVKHGFLCIGSDGGGGMYSFCSDDGKVYLIPSEYVAEDALFTEKWEKMAVTTQNIKQISERAWASLTELFDWSLAELQKMGRRGSA